MKKENWIWMPHAGHWILGDRCKFHLCTYVGEYIVSTVGECPKTIKSSKDDVYETVGAGPQIYETMVFKAKKTNLECCPYEQTSGEDVDCDRYMTAKEAREGHMRFCEKWSNL